MPITLNTPKPLVRVRGTRIIDALLDAVCAAGIEEVYIVRGYYGEQIDALLYKYPNIKFIENPMYSEANNISSLMAASFAPEEPNAESLEAIREGDAFLASGKKGRFTNGSDLIAAAMS